MVVVNQPGSNTPQPISPGAGAAKVSNLITRVQGLLEDPAGNWADQEYLKPFILQANETLNTRLSSINLTYGEKVVTLSNVAAGTTDLSAYMAEGESLADLEEPTVMQWRRVGETDIQWGVVPRKDAVIDSDGTGEAIQSWEWRGGVPYITPSSIAVDLRVRYDGLTVDLDDPTKEVIRGVLNVLALKTAELVTAGRGGLAGTGEPLCKYFERKAEEAEEDFHCLMTKRSQSVRRRFAKSNRASGAPPWTIPIINR